MKKVLLTSVLGLLILVLIGYFVLQYFLGSAVKAGVNKFGPGITQTKVELQGAQISPLSGVGTLSEFAVGNPEGWSPGNAFYLGKVHINVEPRSVFGDHVIINELVIEKPEFLYETKLVSSNIGDLMRNIEQSVGKSESEPKTESGKPVKLVVKKLTMKDGSVTVGVGSAAMKIPLPPIDMTDVGVKEGGITPTQLAVAVGQHVTANVIAAATQAIAKAGLQGGGNASDMAKQAGEALKGLFGGKKKE